MPPKFLVYVIRWTMMPLLLNVSPLRSRILQFPRALYPVFHLFLLLVTDSLFFDPHYKVLILPLPIFPVHHSQALLASSLLQLSIHHPTIPYNSCQSLGLSTCLLCCSADAVKQRQKIHEAMLIQSTITFPYPHCNIPLTDQSFA